MNGFGIHGKQVMSYIDQSLGRNESLHYKAYLPTIRYVVGWGSLIVILAAAIATYLNNFGWIAVLLVLLGFWLFVAIMLPIWTTEIGVTSQRLVYKRGLFRRTTKELQLRAIEEVNLQQGLLGRFFSYGKVELHGTGVDDLRLPTLGDPIDLQRAVQEVIGGAAQAGRVAPPALGMTSQERTG